MTLDRCSEVVVRGEGRLSASDLGQHLRRAQDATVHVDLRRLRFIEPAGLVSLAVITEVATEQGRPIEFHGPNDRDAATYLSRMRLKEHLDGINVAHDLPSVRERDLGARLVELHRFDGPEGLDRVTDALMSTFIKEHPGVVQPLYTALHEMATNVVQHSGRAHGYAALQRFRGDVAFAVGDSGVGLRNRLAERFPVRDDRVAIARAAQTHVSTMNQPGRGRGIARVIRVTGKHGGSVMLLSGTARGAFSRGDPRPQFDALSSAHPGTLAVARLSL